MNVVEENALFIIAFGLAAGLALVIAERMFPPGTLKESST
jgi:hypothetical protein